MKPQLFTIILLLALTGFSTNKNEAAKKSRDDIARCTGSTPCRACSNCSACKWCNAGGTCGICATPKKQSPPRTYKTPVSSQCKARTKKGTRCSRSARSNGYCWQHGG